jgi:iron complex outermembrane receptor protein
MRLVTRFSLSAVLSVSAAFAASIHGSVLDASGRPIPQCRLTVYARDGHQRLTTIADDQGQYRVHGLGAGAWLVEADAPGMTRRVAATVSVAEADARALDIPLDLKLDIAEVRSEVVVTATGVPQSTDEIAKSVDTLDAAELAENAEFSVAESLRAVPGMRVQQLGGPGAYTRIVTRGLRPQDTAVTVDGLRFRDAATTQGDATPFLQDLMLLGTDRIEVLRGTGSSIYGSHATGGVVNLVTDTGGGPLHGQIQAEGGGLGMMRGLARIGGGVRNGRLNYSAGVQSTDFLRGLDANDRFRNHSAQASIQRRFGSNASLTARAWGADSFAQVNGVPYAGPASTLPAGDVVVARPVSLDVQHRIEAGLPFTYDGNFVPELDDPDNRRASRFLTGALVWAHQASPRVGYRVTYSRVITNRVFEDGPAGVNYQPDASVSDRIRGGTDTISAQTDLRLARWNTLVFGYEFERESYRSRHYEAPPAPASTANFAAAGQLDHSLFFSDQLRLLSDRLQVGLSGRWQHFDLRAPIFTGGNSTYTGLVFQSPPDAKTGDASAAYFIPASGTKLRAHVGNGYRSPSIFERFGSSFFNGFFAPLGDPRLRPERTVAFDTGIDQYLLSQKLRVSTTWFYTNLQEVILFDFSGLISPLTDPFHRDSGYLNTGGGIARGLEISAEASPTRSLKLRSAYTYTNADQRRSSTRNQDWFEIPFTSPHQFSFVATQRLGRRIDLVADFWAADRHSAVFSGRAFLFAGPRKLDLVGNYTLPAGDHGHWRFYGKLSNVLDSQYLEGGYRTPGRWGIGGIEFQF